MDFLPRPLQVQISSMQQARHHQSGRHQARLVPLSDHTPGVSAREHRATGFSKLIFNVSGGVVFIDPDNVRVLQADSNYTRVFTRDGRMILLSRTLKACAGRFPASFLRIHQTWLVNPACIRAYDRKECSLHLDNDRVVPVSRSGKVVLQTLIDQYIR